MTCPLRAHPRVCGADRSPRGYVQPRWGSSPRVRGRPPGSRSNPPASGLIPACAGQTRLWRRRPGAHPAHPRVCGADLTYISPPTGWWGSSPRVRGRLGIGQHGDGEAGLIPACAGQTSVGAERPGFTRAHPRVCGADKNGKNVGAFGQGSSPRVRGRPPGGPTGTR